MAFKQFVSRSCFACACFLYYGSACCLWTSFLPKPSFVVHLGLTRGSKSRHWNGQYEMHWGRRADTTLSRLLIVIFYLSQLTKKGDDIFNILQKRLNVNTRSIHLSIHPVEVKVGWEHYKLLWGRCMDVMRLCSLVGSHYPLHMWTSRPQFDPLFCLACCVSHNIFL